jgi:hypothetical protein
VAKNRPGAATQRFSRGANPNDNSVQRTRAWSGFWVVFGGDLAIAAAAIITVWKVAKDGGKADITPIVAILTSAFTAISTMTTAYFCIKTMSNTAQSFAPVATAAVNANAYNNPAASNPPDDDDAPPPRIQPTAPPGPARGPASAEPLPVSAVTPPPPVS